MFSSNRHIFVQNIWELQNSTESRETPVSNQDAVALINNYAAACKKDCYEIWRYCDAVASPFHYSTPKNWRLSEDRLTMAASVGTGTAGGFEYDFPLGLFLACDDFAGMIAPYYRRVPDFLNHEEFTRIRTSDKFWPRRFFDYRHIGEISSSPSNFSLSPLFGPQSFPEFDEIRTLISNMMLFWFFMHEVGHVVLGHCAHFFQYSYGNIFLENSADLEIKENASSHDISELADLTKAREFEADQFATLSLIGLFGNKYNSEMMSENGFPGGRLDFAAILMNIASYCAIIMELGSSRNGISSTIYPSPYARLFNIWATFHFSRGALLINLDLLSETNDDLKAAEIDSTFVDLLSGSLMHIDYLSDALEIDFSTSSPHKEIGHKYRGVHTRLANSHKKIEISKIVLSIFMNSFGINYFTQWEDPFTYISENHKSAEKRFSGLSKMFRVNSGYDYSQDNLGAGIVRSMDEILDMISEDRSRIGQDPNILKYLIGKTAAITSLFDLNPNINLDGY
ncbi:hypothetical protein QMT40_000396 [Parvibaculaceae bacterium PLY_AMNH_Bact1]|nr:hypothetical protein QMT40_000396 [Parvibaculaceae bacterium PLY_AMNH_Bact1]